MDLVKAEKLAKELMQLHGLTAPKWSFKFDNARQRFGQCSTRAIMNNVTRKKEIIYGVISLSKNLTLINDEERVKLTILHEIAHGLTPGHGHDAVWRNTCLRIGGNGLRCFSNDNTNTIERKEPRYKAICGGCGRTHTKNRMTAKTLRSKTACICQNHRNWDDKILLKFIDTKAV